MSQAGKLIPLKAGVTYQASKLPLALRVTSPDASCWLGAQWKSSARGEHSTKPPYFGWVWLSDSFENSAATVVGRSHTFIPFTATQNIARFYGDATQLDKGELLRIIVLNVRHKTVVIWMTTAELPPGDFPTFLAAADTILKSLKFPG